MTTITSQLEALISALRINAEPRNSTNACIKAAEDALAAAPALLAQVREMEKDNFKCKTHSAVLGGDYPMDCNWPCCGCDPKANRVLEAIDESGDFVSLKEHRALQAQLAATQQPTPEVVHTNPTFKQACMDYKYGHGNQVQIAQAALKAISEAGE